MRRPGVEWGYWFKQVMGGITLSVLIVIGSVELGAGFIDHTEAFLVPSLTLIGLGLVLAGVLDRETRLRRIQKLLQSTQDTYLLGVQYFEKTSEATAELEDLVKTAQETIFAIGAKSTGRAYLRRITQKASSGDIRYRRLLTGDHITHQLHEHLGSLVGTDGFQMAWNPSEKWGNLTISEKETIWALPSPKPKEFSAVKLPGQKIALQHTHYFYEAFEHPKSFHIETREDLEVLCESCGEETAHDEKKIKEELENLRKRRAAASQ